MSNQGDSGLSRYIIDNTLQSGDCLYRVEDEQAISTLWLDQLFDETLPFPGLGDLTQQQQPPQAQEHQTQEQNAQQVQEWQAQQAQERQVQQDLQQQVSQMQESIGRQDERIKSLEEALETQKEWVIFLARMTEPNKLKGNVND
jgi:hypothetical protein